MCKKNILKYRKISANEREARQRKCLFSLSNPTREQRDKRNCLRISTSRNVFFVQQKHYIRDGQNQKRVKSLKRKLFFWKSGLMHEQEICNMRVCGNGRQTRHIVTVYCQAGSTSSCCACFSSSPRSDHKEDCG